MPEPGFNPADLSQVLASGSRRIRQREGRRVGEEKVGERERKTGERRWEMWGTCSPPTGGRCCFSLTDHQGVAVVNSGPLLGRRTPSVFLLTGSTLMQYKETGYRCLPIAHPASTCLEPEATPLL
jgi:hypothetical protein